MSTDSERPLPPINPRPGVLRGLGIANIVFASLGSCCILYSAFWFFAMISGAQAKAQAEVQVDVKAQPKPAGTPMVAAFNPFMGMDDPQFIRFSLVENGVSLLTNGLMFVTGIGLINLRRWAARWWAYVAWAKIALALLLWSYFIVGVVPRFSEHLAKTAMAMFAQQNIPAGRGPTLADMTRIYSIMYLIVAVGVILFSSIYPAISLWLLSRPSVKAAIVDKPLVEGELP